MRFNVRNADSYQQWVPVFSTNSSVEAHLVRGLLEGEGILCWLRSKGIALLPVTVNGLGEIDLYVDAADLDACRRILDDVRRKPSQDVS